MAFYPGSLEKIPADPGPPAAGPMLASSLHKMGEGARRLNTSKGQPQGTQRIRLAAFALKHTTFVCFYILNKLYFLENYYAIETPCRKSREFTCALSPTPNLHHCQHHTHSGTFATIYKPTVGQPHHTVPKVLIWDILGGACSVDLGRWTQKYVLHIFSAPSILLSCPPLSGNQRLPVSKLGLCRVADRGDPHCHILSLGDMHHAFSCFERVDSAFCFIVESCSSI